MGYDEAVGYLSKNMGSSIKSYINTPQKLNMFIDVVGKGFSAINQENILEAVGINEKAHVNRRNAAMSLTGTTDSAAVQPNTTTCLPP